MQNDSLAQPSAPVSVHSFSAPLLSCIIAFSVSSSVPSPSVMVNRLHANDGQCEGEMSSLSRLPREKRQRQRVNSVRRVRKIQERRQFTRLLYCFARLRVENLLKIKCTPVPDSKCPL